VTAHVPTRWSAAKAASFARALAVAAALIIGDPSRAQEVSVYRGALSGGSLSTRSYFGWMAEYLQEVHPNFAWSFSALDEGHFNAHHRDGYDVQLWGRAELTPGFTVALGAGPYLTFDTLETDGMGGYVDRHGWAMLYSAVGSWRIIDRWLLLARINRVESRDGVNSTAYLLGLGYRFDREAKSDASAVTDLRARRAELAIMLGATRNNSIRDESAFSGGAEYRRAVGPGLEWTASFIDEGNTGVTQRRGLASQFWIAPRFLDGKLGLGIGVGPYAMHDVYRTTTSESTSKNRVAGLVTLTGDYRFTTDWFARLSWSRAVTNYDRDSDIVLLGLGYAF